MEVLAWGPAIDWEAGGAYRVPVRAGLSVCDSAWLLDRLTQVRHDGFF